MVICGATLGLISENGWQYSAFWIPVLLISILINPIPATADVTTASNIGAAVGTFVVLLVCGLLTIALCLPILARFTVNGPPSNLPAIAPAVARYYAVILAVLLGVATWWVLAYDRVSYMSWLLLTLVLLLTPAAKLSFHKAFIRAAGTIGGSVIALLIALIPIPWVVVFMTILLTSVAMVMVFDSHSHYWRWVMFWTPSIILLTSQQTQIVQATEFRLGTTLVAVVVVSIIALAVQKFKPRSLQEAEFV